MALQGGPVDGEDILWLACFEMATVISSTALLSCLPSNLATRPNNVLDEITISVATYLYSLWVLYGLFDTVTCAMLYDHVYNEDCQIVASPYLRSISFFSYSYSEVPFYYSSLDGILTYQLLQHVSDTKIYLERRDWFDTPNNVGTSTIKSGWDENQWIQGLVPTITTTGWANTSLAMA